MTLLCKALKLSRATFYRYRQAGEAVDRDVEVWDQIQRLALEFPSYGYRRITAQLQREGKPTDDENVKFWIVASFVVSGGEKAEAMCRLGYQEYGRGAIIHVPEVVRGRLPAHSKIPSRQFYAAQASKLRAKLSTPMTLTRNLSRLWS